MENQVQSSVFLKYSLRISALALLCRVTINAHLLLQEIAARQSGNNNSQFALDKLRKNTSFLRSEKIIQ